MRKCIVMLILFVVLCAIFYVISIDDSVNTINISNSEGQADSSKEVDDSNEDPETLKGIWFSYLDWNLLLQGKNQDEFSAAVQTVIENVVSIGCNIIFVHVRAFGDAMYQSEYYPWSKSCSGQIGVDPGYDPLEVMIEIAHQNGVQIHGWINPMRTMTQEEFSQIDDNYIIKQWYNEQRYKYYMLGSDGRYVLIPGNTEVRALIANGAAELAENYDIDGIHMDDYFYPSNVDELSENDLSYYQELNISTSIEDWRRESVTLMMEEIYAAVKQVNENIPVGVSPQSSLSNNYKLCADVENWINNGETIDYIIPQIYFGFNNSSQPFEEAATQWNQLVANTNVKLYIGLAGYKIGLEDDVNAGSGNTEWIEVYQSSNDILKRQIEYLKSLPNCQGYCFYDYKSFFEVDGSIKASAENEIANIKDIE